MKAPTFYVFFSSVSHRFLSSIAKSLGNDLAYVAKGLVLFTPPPHTHTLSSSRLLYPCTFTYIIVPYSVLCRSLPPASFFPLSLSSFVYRHFQFLIVSSRFSNCLPFFFPCVSAFLIPNRQTLPFHSSPSSSFHLRPLPFPRTSMPWRRITPWQNILLYLHSYDWTSSRASTGGCQRICVRATLGRAF